MRNFRLIFCSLLLALAAFSPKPALAWGKAGHLTVCDLAYRNFTPATREKLKAMFADGGGAVTATRTYTAFNYACLEEDAFPRRHPADHFINFPRNQLNVAGSACPGAGTCILAGISRDLAVLRSPSSTPKEQARALMAVGHWIGDIHQPLHISFADDRGGNYITATGACATTKLHSVWDNCVIERRILKRIPVQPGWSEYTPVYRTVDRFRTLEARDMALIASWKSGDPWQWAAESYAIALQPGVGYCTRKGAECWYSADKRVHSETETERSFVVTPAYLDTYEPVVELRLRKAGYRLAHLVNLALDPAYRG